MPPLAYLALKAVILGSLTGAIFHFLEQKKLLCHEFFTPLTIGRIYPESLLLLLQDPLFWLGCLGVGWIWKKETPSPGVTLWIWNFILWSAVYLTAVYWHRFALPALFLACPAGGLFSPQGCSPADFRDFHPCAPVGGAGFHRRGAGFVLPRRRPGFLQAGSGLPGLTPRRTWCTICSTHVPARCLIETPEYELAFLDDDHRIHLMPSYFFVESTPDRVTLLNPRRQPYEFNRVGADILILGSFGKSVFKQVYPPALINREWRRIARVDYYDIYVSRKSAQKMLTLINKTLASHQKASLVRPASHDNVAKTLVNSYYQ